MDIQIQINHTTGIQCTRCSIWSTFGQFCWMIIETNAQLLEIISSTRKLEKCETIMDVQPEVATNCE